MNHSTRYESRTKFRVPSSIKSPSLAILAHEKYDGAIGSAAAELNPVFLVASISVDYSAYKYTESKSNKNQSDGE